MAKVAYSIAEAARATAVKVEMIKDAIRLGDLPARDAEGTPVILHPDLKVWAKTLPAWEM
jgi:hypothetical protein